MTKNRQKLNCAKFFEKFKNCFFFYFFSVDVLKSLLRGPKTIRKKYQVVFEKFANLCSKSRKKNQPPILAKFFEKKNIPIFFREYSKIKCRNIYLRELKKLRKIMKQFSRYGPKKKSGPTIHPSHPIHPIHPIHPSVNIKNWRGQKPR